MKLRHPIVLLVLPLLAGAMTAGAQSLYKWVDEKGRVTYSDQPPPSANVKSQEQVRVVTPINSNAAKDMATRDTAFKKRQEEANKKAAELTKKEQQEAAKAEACTRARGDLRAIRDNIPIARVNESGERVLLDAAGRDSESRRIEGFLEENCTSPG